MPNYSKKIVYLSKAQYQELIANNSVTVNGVTVTYNENDIYVTPQAEPITDVKIDNVSIGSNGVANIPVASNSSLGVVSVNPSAGIMIASNILATNPATADQIKAGTNGNRPLCSTQTSNIAFYGLAKAANDSTQSASNNAIGVYTDPAKQSIQKMLGFANIFGPYEDDITADQAYAIGETFIMDGKRYKVTAAIAQGGVITPGTNCDLLPLNGDYFKKSDVWPARGITYDISTGQMYVNCASDADIKEGTNTYKPVAPLRQHTSIFYGLSKLAGVDLASETVTVGTYPNVSKTAINTLIGSVSKENLDNAGITAKTYTTKFGGEFTVTTATTSGWNNPYARASVIGRIDKHHMHRVTINGTEYILRTRLWYHATNGNIKIYEYLGNLGLYLSSTSGVPGGVDNVPFVIISDLNDSSSIDVITQMAGTYTIKIEQINVTKTELPKSLIWDDDYVPLEKLNNGGTYNGFSIGVNELTNKRGTIAIGYANKVMNEFGIVLGEGNILNAPSSYTEGSGNEITGFNSNMSHSNHVEGYVNNFTKLGMCNHIEGMNNQGSGIISNMHVEGAANILNSGISVTHVEGISNVVNANTSHIEGAYNIANGSCMHIQGTYNVADVVFSSWVSGTSYNVGDYIYKDYTNASTPSGPFICIEGNSDTTFNALKWKKLPGRSDTAMIIGNGTADNARSNALKVDWLGNAYFNGIIRVNCNADSTGGTILPTDIQINGTSIVSNGIATIPYANVNNSGGIVRANVSFGITYAGDGLLAIDCADAATIKTGTNAFHPIVPYFQHNSVFYGLAKAAGDSTQSSSENAVGTYTDNAKTAIQTMLGTQAAIEVIRL